MSNKINYDKLMVEVGERSAQGSDGKRLLLHSCCAPCSSYCVEETLRYFDVTVYYYNPNIDTAEEYRKRRGEEIRFLNEFSVNGKKADYVVEEHRSEEFYEVVKGYEDVPEGGSRCVLCFELRLRKTAEYAACHGYDYFTTTLTVSPLKNAEVINKIGEKIGKEYGIKFLPSDFKKRGGYLRSIELSHTYNLYRQNYCGCRYSKERK